MAFDDGLLAALDRFNAGIKQYQTQQAVNDAGKQLQDLNTQALGDKEKLSANADVGNQLALRLTGIGADHNQIKAATEGLIPSAGSMAQVQGQERMATGAQTGEMARKQLEESTKLQIEQMKVDALLGKTSKKDFGDATNKFEKQPGVQDVLKGIPKLQDAYDKIAQTEGGFGVTAMINLAQLGLIRGVAGRVNEQEIKGANETQSARMQLAKKMGIEYNGEVSQNIQTFWKTMMQKSIENSKGYVRKAAKGYAQSVSMGNPNVDSSLLEKSLVTRHGVQNPNQAQIDALKAAITSDPTNPRVKEAQDKVNQLESQ